ncbi:MULTISPECIES: type I methionyl aminopeptidase [unclassified Bartonella]|uniref:type I methionyl aminopeptidase n=1 Tax=unclassified Bartonella TaxID=2645622 RepID=UPI0015FE2D12|nr:MULTISPECIES: type I methionyl aminopeptidase [unclassified Bartonella]UXN07549.1 type I methionyl aminopeptidase [Bartonella sp. HY761]
MVSYIDYKKVPIEYTGQIRIFDEEGFAGMRKACNLAARCLDALIDFIKPGITTQSVDDFVFAFGAKEGALPADLNYRGFTHSCCTSLNHVVCHGIPGARILKEGDIVNVDVTFIVDGWHGDSSRMYPVGKIKRAAERLMEVTHESLMLAIAAVKPGARTGAIGHAIQTYAESQRCSVVRNFCGHGVGQLFHDTPNIVHYGIPSDGPELREGMIFTIEPMINLGKPDVKILNDGWTAVTNDKSLTAQYEHTVGVTANGCEIFTLSPANMFYIPPKS